MLNEINAVATIAVHDLDKARDFYEGKLDLAPIEEPNDMVLTYKSGDVRLMVYKSEFAGGYDATVATWPMEQGIEDLVRTLKSKGVKFERYEGMPHITLEGDLHINGDMKTAWFKDPEGNIHCLVQSPHNTH